MLLHERRLQRKRQKLANISFIRNSFFMLIVFNICTFAHTQVTSKSAVNPISKSKLINEMIVYQFAGSLVLIGGLYLMTPASRED